MGLFSTALARGLKSFGPAVFRPEQFGVEERHNLDRALRRFMKIMDSRWSEFVLISGVDHIEDPAPTARHDSTISLLQPRQETQLSTRALYGGMGFTLDDQRMDPVNQSPRLINVLSGSRNGPATGHGHPDVGVTEDGVTEDDVLHELGHDVHQMLIEVLDQGLGDMAWVDAVVVRDAANRIAGATTEAARSELVEAVRSLVRCDPEKLAVDIGAVPKESLGFLNRIRYRRARRRYAYSSALWRIALPEFDAAGLAVVDESRARHCVELVISLGLYSLHNEHAGYEKFAEAFGRYVQEMTGGAPSEFAVLFDRHLRAQIDTPEFEIRLTRALHRRVLSNTAQRTVLMYVMTPAVVLGLSQYDAARLAVRGRAALEGDASQFGVTASRRPVLVGPDGPDAAARSRARWARAAIADHEVAAMLRALRTGQGLVEAYDLACVLDPRPLAFALNVADQQERVRECLSLLPRVASAESTDFDQRVLAVRSEDVLLLDSVVDACRNGLRWEELSASLRQEVARPVRSVLRKSPSEPLAFDDVVTALESIRRVQGTGSGLMHDLEWKLQYPELANVGPPNPAAVLSDAWERMVHYEVPLQTRQFRQTTSFEPAAPVFVS